METNINSIPVSAHLKSDASFKLILIRQLTSAVILAAAACFSGGEQFVFAVAIVLITVTAGDAILQAVGFISQPRWDLTLFHQALLMILFLPVALAWEMLAVGAAIFVIFYRLSGGRSGYVLQPVCLTLAFLQCFGMRFQFHLTVLPFWAAAFVFVLWLVIRFPKTPLEIYRLLASAALIPLLFLLHDVPLMTAALWSAAASELIFDSALAPLAAKARNWYWIIMLIIFALLLAVTDRNEALVLTGLIAGFFAGWIETRGLTRKKI